MGLKDPGEVAAGALLCNCSFRIKKCEGSEEAATGFCLVTIPHTYNLEDTRK